jgi:hypothetical protein
MATPFVAGVAALIRQYLREGWHPSAHSPDSIGVHPTAALLKALLIAGASDLNFQSLIHFARSLLARLAEGRQKQALRSSSDVSAVMKVLDVDLRTFR